MEFVQAEIASQPECWRLAGQVAAREADRLPVGGERVAVVGCGTSWFVGQSYAALRELAGQGETDAFAASEFVAAQVTDRRRYDRVVALTRSGTTTEVVQALQQVAGTIPTLAITADAGTPVGRIADRAVVLDFADECSVVQTRFATSVLALLRAQLGQDLEPVTAQAEAALAEPMLGGALDRHQFTFLGTGWSVGLANEAALKLREASLSWTESYPAMEYRHGPMSITDERSAVWFLGPPPLGLAEEVRRLGALVVDSGRDPMAELVAVQRLAVALGQAKGLDPDTPRNLSRSVVLPAPDPA